MNRTREIQNSVGQERETLKYCYHWATVLSSKFDKTYVSPTSLHNMADTAEMDLTEDHFVGLGVDKNGFSQLQALHFVPDIPQRVVVPSLDVSFPLKQLIGRHLQWRGVDNGVLMLFRQRNAYTSPTTNHAPKGAVVRSYFHHLHQIIQVAVSLCTAEGAGSGQVGLRHGAIGINGHVVQLGAVVAAVLLLLCRGLRGVQAAGDVRHWSMSVLYAILN